MSVFCFIYLKHLEDNGCLSIKLDQQGQVLADSQWRSFEELQQFQQNTVTIIVLPAEHFSFQRVEMPWLADKKARAVIPYALEDKVAENIDELHFAFDRHYYHDNHYLVAVCKKNYLNETINTLIEKGIAYGSITVDWFAVNPGEIVIIDTTLLINRPDFCGALTQELTPFYPPLQMTEQQVIAFQSNSSALVNQHTNVLKEPALLWLSRRLLVNKSFDICQGEFQSTRDSGQLKHWYWAAGGMAALWICSVILLNTLQLHRLNNQLAQTDGEIKTIYRQFFPGAQQVISPKFRIEQLLKSQGSTNDNALWTLLNQLTIAAKANDAQVEQIRYQNQLLLVNLVCKDFTALETLETDLQKSNIKVRQTEASTREQSVLATLELSL